MYIKNKNDIEIKNQDIGQKSISNFENEIVLFFVVCLLIIDFFPSFKSIDIIGPQYFYLSVLNIVIGLYLYCNTQIIDTNLIVILKKSYLLKIYILFLIGCGISFYSSKNIFLSLVSYYQLIIIFLLLINVIVLFYNKLHLIKYMVLLVGISVFIESFQQLSTLYNTSSILDSIKGLKGNTGNVNILASSMNVKIPFLIYGFIQFLDWKKWFLLVTLFLAATCVFLTASRSAFLGINLEIISFAILYLIIKKDKKESVKKIVFVFLAIILALITSNAVFSNLKNGNERYKSVTKRFDKVEISKDSKDSSSQQRLVFWSNAKQIIQNQPVLGIGLGNWLLDSIPFESKFMNDSIVSVHPHNDFIEIIAETGILNGLIYLGLFISLFYINLRKIVKTHKEETQLIALLAFIILVGYGIDAFFNFPLYRPTMQICLIFSLVFSVLNGTIVEKKIPKIVSSKIFFPIILFGCITTYFAYHTLKSYQLQFELRQNDSKNKYLSSNYLIHKIPKYSNLEITSTTFEERIAKSYLNEKNYDEALRHYKLSDKINPYVGNSDYYRSVIAKQKGDIDSAYFFIKKAFYKRPRNLNFFSTAIHIAQIKMDTTEILKIHELNSKYRPSAESWSKTASALRKAKYSTRKLLLFMDKGLELYPKDSLLTSKKKMYSNNRK
jgi:O-antigen ligase